MVCNWNRSHWDAHNFTLHRFETALVEWTVACAPLTIVLNAVVLYIAFRYVRVREKLSQRFVVLLTVADLAHGLVYMATKQYVHCFPRALCAAYYFFVWFTNMLSVLALVFLNVDRFVYVRVPLRYYSIITSRVVALEIAGGCALSLGACFVTYFTATSYSENHVEWGLTACQIRVEPLFYASLTIVFYIVPTLVCLAISVYIFGVAQRSMRADAKQAAAIRCRIASRSNDVHQELMARPSQFWRPKSKLLKRVFFVFASTVFTSLTVLPYRIALSVFTLTSGGPAFTDVVYALWFLLPLSAVLNPIITVVTQRAYRRGLCQIFERCGVTCRRRRSETGSERTLETQLEVFRLL